MRAAMEPPSTPVEGWVQTLSCQFKSRPGPNPERKSKSQMSAINTRFSRVMRSAHNQSRRIGSSRSYIIEVNNSTRFLLESLILAQDERWRRA
jgi:hypothetical protein